eukprot:635057-Hanusia_phi.AAC.1
MPAARQSVMPRDPGRAGPMIGVRPGGPFVTSQSRLSGGNDVSLIMACFQLDWQCGQWDPIPQQVPINISVGQLPPEPPENRNPILDLALLRLGYAQPMMYP